MGDYNNKQSITTTMKKADNTIADNPRARRDYSIEDRFEAGLVLEGWEVKSLRQKRLQLKESYAYVKDCEIWLLGAHISPLPSSNANPEPLPTRTRKLLLNKPEIRRLIGAVERKGYTLVPIKAYWKNNRAKIELGLGKGKHTHDRRADEKQRDWHKQKHRLLKRPS